ncbi:MAG: hypothetical protein WD225_03380, partial [Ilumatobacteraceae bacterium]
MSDDPSGETEPDAAALDELMRAFTPAHRRQDEVDETDQPDETGETGEAGETGEVDEVDEVDDQHVIAIEDDELPDPVYVEGDLGGPDKQGRRDDLVFIDDDDTGDTITLGAASGGGARMEP